MAAILDRPGLMQSGVSPYDGSPQAGSPLLNISAPGAAAPTGGTLVENHGTTTIVYPTGIAVTAMERDVPADPSNYYQFNPSIVKLDSSVQVPIAPFKTSTNELPTQVQVLIATGPITLPPGYRLVVINQVAEGAPVDVDLTFTAF